MFDLLLLGIAFVCLLIASIEDWKTREVPDYLSYFFIAAALFIRLLWAVYEWDLNILIWVPLSFGIFTTFSYLMYKGGQWGGGDVKLMMGLSIALSSFQTYTLFPYFLNFFMNVLIAGSIYGIVMMVYTGIKNRKKLVKKIGAVDKILIPSIAIGVIAVAYYFRFNIALAFMGILLVVSLGLFRYLKLIENCCMQNYVPVKNLTEGDWLINDVRKSGIVVKSKTIGLEEDDLKKLRKLHSAGKLDKVLIKTGIPFVPAFFLAFLLTQMFGNIIFALLSNTLI
jgi:prepilin signal peptidase PulO-like enzyme (type II secretory pathway)